MNTAIPMWSVIVFATGVVFALGFNLRKIREHSERIAKLDEKKADIAFCKIHLESSRATNQKIADSLDQLIPIVAGIKASMDGLTQRVNFLEKLGWKKRDEG
jgi:hypothetical protein